MMVFMTGEPLYVSLAELRSSFDILLRHVEAAVAGDAIALDRDFFWSIPGGEQYDIYTQPGNLTIGQLSEPWQHLRDLLADQDLALGYHLVWLADVLRAIGQGLPN